MKPLHNTSLSILFILALAPRVMSEPVTAASSKALLDEAKKEQLERKRAAMQTELNRLSEDARKGGKGLADFEQSISKVGNAESAARSSIDQLAILRRNTARDLELLTLRSAAEKLNAEALNLLNVSNAKAKDALAKRNEELELKRALISAEFLRIEESQSAGEASRRSKSGASSTVAEIRRNLAKAQDRASLANYRAREAMDAASQKFHEAEAAAARVEKRKAEFASDNNSGASGATDAPTAKGRNGQ